jgi:hypothetical protein
MSINTLRLVFPITIEHKDKARSALELEGLGRLLPIFDPHIRTFPFIRSPSSDLRSSAVSLMLLCVL